VTNLGRQKSSAILVKVYFYPVGQV